MSNLTPIELLDCRKIGLGVQRPEDVVVDRDGVVWLSDQASACARVLDNGTLERIGRAGGAPNGINMDLEGRIIIANFGGPDDGFGPLQRLDPATGEIEVLCGEIDGRKLFGANYPIVDSGGRIWFTHSTWGPMDAAYDSVDDGILIRYDLDGSATVVAEGIKLSNGVALDYDEQHIFVCETIGCDVLRYEILTDGTLGTPERYGPQLGFTSAEMQDKRPLSLVQRGQLGLTDGCGFDADGNLWVTLVAANKVVAITPAGQVITMLSDPAGTVMRNPTNVSWGGKDMCDLYIGSISTDYVLHARSPIPGMPLVHQR